MRLDSAQTDRACGVLVAAACGDALGAGYEFGVAPLPPAGTPPDMIGGGLGGFAPGEWTDDTAQTWAVAEVAATGADLRSPEALTAIARRFADWYADGPADIGVQTGAVLAAAGRRPTGKEMSSVARRVHEGNGGRSAGNGALMRTAAVALAHLDEPDALVEAAMKVSALTHHDPRAGEAAALWCLMIAQTVRTGSLSDVRRTLVHLPEASRDFWSARLEEAEARPPGSFRPNGWVVAAFMAAWSAIVHTPVPEERPSEGSFACLHLQHALETAVRIGDDTDTVASIAGALLGARWGVSAVPATWREVVHGWPGRGTADLMHLAVLTVGGGRPDRQGWPGVDRMAYDDEASERWALHPHDSGVVLGGAAVLDLLDGAPSRAAGGGAAGGAGGGGAGGAGGGAGGEAGGGGRRTGAALEAALGGPVDAVVSLCRLGAGQVPESLRAHHHEFRLLDTVAEANPNLGFVLHDAARTVARLRAEGRRVLLHCVAGRSRTPTVAAAYSMVLGVAHDDAVGDVRRALPWSAPQPHLVAALRELGGAVG